MTQKETTAIALKCFAIYVLSIVLIGFAWNLQLAHAYRHSPLIWIIEGAAVLLGGAAVFVLWKVANSLVSERTVDSQSTKSTDFDAVLKNILICMGIYFAINGLVALPYTIANCHLMAQSPSPKTDIAWMSLATPALKLVIGLLLIAKPKQWVRAIRSIGEK